MLEIQGLSTFLKLRGDLSESIQKNQPVGEDEQSSRRTVNFEDRERNMGNNLIECKAKNSLINVNARREFKISGSVGAWKRFFVIYESFLTNGARKKS